MVFIAKARMPFTIALISIDCSVFTFSVISFLWGDSSFSLAGTSSGSFLSIVITGKINCCNQHMDEWIFIEFSTLSQKQIDIRKHTKIIWLFNSRTIFALIDEPMKSWWANNTQLYNGKLLNNQFSSFFHYDKFKNNFMCFRSLIQTIHSIRIRHGKLIKPYE